MTFSQPLWFILLFLLPFMWWFKNRQKKSGISVTHLQKIQGAWSLKVLAFQSLEWFQYLLFIFLVFAMARPQSSESVSKNLNEGIDIVICLDVSDSMLIEDMEPLNRLESAKETIRRFVNQRKNDRIGLVIFAGQAFTLIPLTLDHKMIDTRIQDIKTAQDANIKDGTALGVALAAGASRLRDSDAKSKVLVFLTDGENNSGTIDPETGLEIVKGHGIRIYSIGIGRDGPTRLPVFQRDMFGNRIKTYQPFESTVNEELLQRMASETGGQFFRASREDSLSSTFAEIDKLETNESENESFLIYEEKFMSFALVGLILYLLITLLSSTTLRTFP